MSHTHTINGEPPLAVSDHQQSSIIPSIASLPGQSNNISGCEAISSQDVTKTVKISAGKRRKVVTNGTSTPAAPRKTRFGGEKTIDYKLVKSTTAIPISSEKFKTVTKASCQKRLHDTFELHDSKVRELFHLTKFVTLVDYDANAAKQDESEVFQEVLLPFAGTVADLSKFKQPFDLWQKAADAKSGGRIRSTRHAISTQKDALGSTFNAQSLPKPSTSTPTFRRPKRSLLDKAASYVPPKRGQRSLVLQPVQNGVGRKLHKRKSSNDATYSHLLDSHDLSTTRSPRF